MIPGLNDTKVSACGCCNDDTPEEDTTPPEEVSDPAASPGDTEATLTWTDPSDDDFDHCIIAYGSNGNADQSFGGTIDSNGTIITGLTNGEVYTFIIKTVDKTGNVSTGTSTTAAPNPAPIVTSSTPADGAASISPSLSAVEIVFDRNMGTGYSVTTNRRVDRSYSWTDLLTFQITINEPLLSSTEFIFTLNSSDYPPGFRSTESIALEEDTQISFTTADDNSAPTITATDPVDGTTGAPRDITGVYITFDDAMINAWSLNLGDLGNYTPAGVDMCDWVASNKIRINIDSQLAANTSYTVTLNPVGYSDNFKNGTGIILPQNTSFTFETGP